jgi:dipeptide/tripeptide permease
LLVLIKEVFRKNDCFLSRKKKLELYVLLLVEYDRFLSLWFQNVNIRSLLGETLPRRCEEVSEERFQGLDTTSPPSS